MKDERRWDYPVEKTLAVILATVPDVQLTGALTVKQKPFLILIPCFNIETSVNIH